MRGRAVLVVMAAALACLFARAAANGQSAKGSPPCFEHKGDAAKYADCMDTRELNSAFGAVLGRGPTAAESAKWKKTPPVKTATYPGETRYVNLLLNWLLRPEQGTELSAMVGRAFKDASGNPPGPSQRAHWEKAVREKRATYAAIRNVATPDLTVSKTEDVSGNNRSIKVYVANVGSWGATSESTLQFLAYKGCYFRDCPPPNADRSNRETLYFKVPPLAPGASVAVVVTSQGRIHTGGGGSRYTYALSVNEPYVLGQPSKALPRSVDRQDTDNNVMWVVGYRQVH